MTPEKSTLALIESPTQLIHVLEWYHKNPSYRPQVLVLAPNERRGHKQLSSVAAMAKDDGLQVNWLEPRLSRWHSVNDWFDLRHQVRETEQLIIGDPFSGLIQSLLPGIQASHLIVVDDGTATIEFADLLCSRKSLVRWTANSNRPHPLRRLLGLTASRLFTNSLDKKVELFTVMPVRVPPNIKVTRHNYEWTRSRFGPPQITEQVTFIGSSLVESRVLHLEAYLDALTNAMGTSTGTYFAHRRENPKKLAKIAKLTGLTIVHSQVPLEIELCKGPVGQRIVCFPSTPAYTLPLILRDTGALVDVVDIKKAWVHPDAGLRITSFLTKMQTRLRKK